MRILVIIFVLFCLSCSKSTEPINPVIQISGNLIDESIQRPIDNIQIHLNRYNENKISAIIDSARTDRNGIFHIEYKPLDESQFQLELWVNFLFRNLKFSSKRIKIPINTKINETIYLYEYTQLEIVLKTNNPLTPTDTFKIDLPGISSGGLGAISELPFKTNLAKGNFFNTIKFTFYRHGIKNVIIDSIYCPTEVKTNMVINY